MKILVTGHTGFKGAWLVEMLHQLGHEVYGVSALSDQNSLYFKAGLRAKVHGDFDIDIRDLNALKLCFAEVKPDLVIHLAAQSLVRRSYLDPATTFEINCQGTINTLEAVRDLPSLRGVLVITTDKVYRNDNSGAPFIETDPLGGDDPYAASKAMADIYSQAFASFTNAKVVIARAGNVVGGGDVCEDRLIPDLIRAIENKAKLQIRNPNSTRPWQHVLDCLGGYLSIIDNWDSIESGSTWNIGPNPNSTATVEEVIKILLNKLNLKIEIEVTGDSKLKEAQHLSLDPTMAARQLGTRNLLDITQTLELVAEFQTSLGSGETPANTLTRQVRDYLKLVPRH